MREQEFENRDNLDLKWNKSKIEAEGSEVRNKKWDFKLKENWDLNRMGKSKKAKDELRIR